MLHRKKIVLPLVLVVVWLFSSVFAMAQTSPPKQYTDTEIVEVVKNRLKEVENLQLDDASKAKVGELYQQALREIESAKTWSAKRAFFEKQKTNAPTELQQTKAMLAALPTQPTSSLAKNPNHPANLSLIQIDQLIAKEEAELEQQRRSLTEIEAEPSHRDSRRTKIPELTAAAQDKLAEVNAEFQAPVASDDNSPLVSARRMYLAMRRRNLQQEILSYDSELGAYEALAELLPLRRDLAARQATLLEQDVKQLQEIANKRRQEEAKQQAQQASMEAAQAPPALKRLAEEKANLADRRTTLARQITETTQQLDQTNQALKTIKDQFEKTKAREQFGLTDVTGLLLRKERETTLPNLRSHHQTLTALQQNIRKNELDLFELREQRYQLSDVDLKAQELLQSLNWTEDPNHRGELEMAVREALQSQRDCLDALINDHGRYFQKLVDLNSTETELVKETEDYAQHINERVFWISSAMAFNAGDIRRSGEALWWLVGPEACMDVARTLAADAARNPMVPGVSLCLFLSLFYWQLRFRARIQELGEKASRGSCTHFWPTLEVSVLTLMISVLWPGLLWYFGWRLSFAADASDLCKSVGTGLMVTARVQLFLEILRYTCCNQGLADVHFGWAPNAIKSLRQNLRWVSLPLLPAVFITKAMSSADHESWDSSLGRMSFVVALLLTAIFLQRILRPNGGVAQAVLARRRGGWLDRFRHILYPLGVLVPMALATTASIGYYYTAQQLAMRLSITLYLLIGILLVQCLLLRWTVVSQRRLAVEQARERRTAAQNEIRLGEESPVSSGNIAVKPDRDLGAIVIQARRFLGYTLTLVVTLGIWCIWADVLPAFSILKQVQLWRVDAITTVANDPMDSQSLTKLASVAMGESTPSESKTFTQSADSSSKQRGWVTLADLVLALLVFATTMIGAKNIPGLLEVAVSQHLPFDAGARYAVTMVSRYFIIILGTVLSCGMIGLGWAKVQWLVAAVSLGLGFGLQEIFANFVSGLIILFERPVRVNDVVTIDNVTGVVSRIHLRTTTITDWDRKELIIPNKEFITGRVLNWTLSDMINRVVINVGIAYGSDTQRATAILEKLAKSHPNILGDPPPRVTLESFGDSALNFVLRFFLPDLENRITVVHEMHMLIDQAFREAGIEMAFPQQDIHVRSVEGLQFLPNATSRTDSVATSSTLPWPGVSGQASPPKPPTLHAA
jgi:potassium efflux system protein